MGPNMGTHLLLRVGHPSTLSEDAISVAEVDGGIRLWATPTFMFQRNNTKLSRYFRVSLDGGAPVLDANAHHSSKYAVLRVMESFVQLAGAHEPVHAIAAL